MGSFEARIPCPVPDSLDELTGLVTGVVDLPVHLDWGPDPSYDLADPDRRLALYVAVISEAGSVAELARYLNHELLVELWPRLRLPRHCVRRWHDAFPELAALGSENAWR
jgi:hypothetical protein